MLRFISVDGAAFAGPTPAAVVREMRDAAWMAGPKGEYMEEVAHRCREIEPRRLVDPTSATAFIRTLVAAGFLKKAR